MVHSRISDRVRLDPIGDTFADWTPTVDDSQWQTYLKKLAEAADKRREQLGQAAAVDPPAWAVEALGPPPPLNQTLERDDWEEDAASVAVYRELVGYDDETDALGPPPKFGQVERYAAWRSAWRALGRPEADRAEAEMSTGQLRVRVRAYDREKTWAPDYVADQLAGTYQAVDKHRQDAALWDAQAKAAAEQDSTARLLEDAAKSAALADALEKRARQLTEADQARAAWYAHTAETRAAAERAAAELSTRQVDRLDEPPPVTAQGWLAAHEAEVRIEDPYRPITDDSDLTDAAHQRARDQRDARADEPVAGAAEAASREIRQEAAKEPTAKQSPADDPAGDPVRVPTADETAESVRRAQRALHELKQRQAIDTRHAETDVRDEASRRHVEELGREVNQDAHADSSRAQRGTEPLILDASV